MAESREQEEVKFSLNVVINRERTKVLFADVDSDFADVLLSFLTLGLGTIVRLLQKHYGEQAPVFGSLSTLYSGLANLDNVHFWTEAGKLMLLNPRSSFEAECRKLKLNLDDTEVTKYFRCMHCSSPMRVCMYYFSCYHCGEMGNSEIGIAESKTQTAKGDGVFTINTLSFLMADDLRMVPNVATSFMQTLGYFGITDTSGIEQINVTFGFDEIMDLLKGSLLSSTPLTDLILKKAQTHFPIVKFKRVNYVGKGENSNSKKMFLKVILQKSTQRFMFAQAEEDFIDFLLCFLSIPLGAVEWLLGGNSGLRNIDNLYRSLDNLKECLVILGTGNTLFKPELAPMYLSKNQFFSVTEQTTPELYHTCFPSQRILSSEKLKSYCEPVKIMDPKGLEGSYVKGPRMYVITDDLTVTPLLLSSRLSILARMQVPVSDVEERELEIGLEEGLSILKASLTSTCALGNGLSSILTKQAKPGQSEH